MAIGPDVSARNVLGYGTLIVLLIIVITDHFFMRFSSPNDRVWVLLLVAFALIDFLKVSDLEIPVDTGRNDTDADTETRTDTGAGPQSQQTADDNNDDRNRR